MRTSKQYFRLALALGCALALLAARASAQDTRQNGTIQGTVTDASSAALPGVTVEVSGPSLQIPRSTVSDSEGKYAVPNLPPGTFRISFSLTGFQSEIRDGFALSLGFSARLDVAMKIGSIEESIIVSGQSPVIDLSTTVSSSTLTRNTLDSVPTTRSIYQAVYIAPGVRPSNTPDVGGSQLGNQQAVVSYGVAGTMVPLLDGINTSQGGSSSGVFYDYDSLEEVQIRATGSDADVAVPGTSMVTVMKSGGNTFHGTRECRRRMGCSASDQRAGIAGCFGREPVRLFLRRLRRSRRADPEEQVVVLRRLARPDEEPDGHRLSRPGRRPGLRPAAADQPGRQVDVSGLAERPPGWPVRAHAQVSVRAWRQQFRAVRLDLQLSVPRLRRQGRSGVEPAIESARERAGRRLPAALLLSPPGRCCRRRQSVECGHPDAAGDRPDGQHRIE